MEEIVRTSVMAVEESQNMKKLFEVAILILLVLFCPAIVVS
jgi:hypothetical protein